PPPPVESAPEQASQQKEPKEDEEKRGEREEPESPWMMPSIRPVHRSARHSGLPSSRRCADRQTVRHAHVVRDHRNRDRTKYTDKHHRPPEPTIHCLSHGNSSL